MKYINLDQNKVIGITFQEYFTKYKDYYNTLKLKPNNITIYKSRVLVLRQWSSRDKQTN